MAQEKIVAVQVLRPDRTFDYFILDEEGEILAFPDAERALGWAKGNLQGKAWSVVFTKRDVPKHAPFTRTCVECGRVFHDIAPISRCPACVEKRDAAWRNA